MQKSFLLDRPCTATTKTLVNLDIHFKFSASEIIKEFSLPADYTHTLAAIDMSILFH
jgi:hypothetical protein